MKVLIETFERKIVKENLKTIEVELPNEQCWFFETHIRRSIQITPIWSTHNKEFYNKEEEIYGYEIICVYQSYEHKVELLEESISSFESNYNDDKKVSILKKYTLGHLNKRTKEQFDEDLECALNKFKK